MQLCDLPAHFHLVPLAETRGYHPARNERRAASSMAALRRINRANRLAMWQAAEGHDTGWRPADPMEVQDKLLLRAVRDDLRERADSDEWDLRS